MAKSSDAARLEEVKSLLHQLQRIRSEPANADQQDRPDGDAATASSEARALPVTPLIMGGAALLTAASIGAWFLFTPQMLPNPEPAAAPQSMAIAPLPLPSPVGAPEPRPETAMELPLLRQAQQMMLGGDISGARAILAQSADSGPPDVALALARSYDPNFLRSVSNPNAAPDIEQATLWYRRWHNAAVQNGQITDALRLDRILRSMQ
jgi:hypothetical protein